jgi:hypothetical protein
LAWLSIAFEETPQTDTSNRLGPQGALSGQGQTLKDGYALARWPQREQLDKLDIVHGGLFDNPRDIL